MKSRLDYVSRFGFALATTIVLTACGGSKDSVDPIKVTSISSDTLAYRKTATITVKGVNLDQGFNLSHLGCLKLAEVSGANKTEKKFTCKMIAVGQVAVKATDASGNTLFAGTETIALSKQPMVKIDTSMGAIEVELNPAKAPVSVDNFLNYVESSFYTGKIFHRVIKDFMIQGGGFDINLTPAQTQAAIKSEVNNGLSNLRGTIAMARTDVLNSATSQFFINVVDNPSLDTSGGGYAVFGKVTKGMDIADNIRAVPTTTKNNMNDVPVNNVLINSVTVIQ